MYVFVDEAGNFQPTGRPGIVSCAAAVLVPESCVRALFRRHRTLTEPWRNGASELKASSLDERQAAAITKALVRFDIVAVVASVDMSAHSDEVLTRGKTAQAQRIIESIESWMTAGQRAFLERSAEQLRGLSNQLFAQFIVLTELAMRVIETAPIYYAQREPQTLGSFRWRFDAKDKTVTPSESLWSKFVAPLTQTVTLRRPLLGIRNLDYSAFNRFLQTEFPEHLAGKRRGPGPYLNLGKILGEDRKFVDSRRCTGIQLADFVATTVRRACNERLGRAGWSDLGRLFVQPIGEHHAIQPISMGGGLSVSSRHADVLRHFDRTGKRMANAHSRRKSPHAKWARKIRRGRER